LTSSPWSKPPAPVISHSHSPPTKRTGSARDRSHKSPRLLREHPPAPARCSPQHDERRPEGDRPASRRVRSPSDTPTRTRRWPRSSSRACPTFLQEGLIDRERTILGAAIWSGRAARRLCSVPIRYRARSPEQRIKSWRACKPRRLTNAPVSVRIPSLVPQRTWPYNPAALVRLIVNRSRLRW
jgi:hypothetical protein